MNVNPFRYTLENVNTGVTKVLEASVSQWETATENMYRHEIYQTVDIEEQLSMRYINKGGEGVDEGGYWFVKAAYEADGYEANVLLHKEKLNRYTNGYEPFYTGKLQYNPEGYKPNLSDKYIDINSISTGKLEKFLARDQINYNVFSLISSDDVTVTDFTNPYRLATYPKVDLYRYAYTAGNWNGSDSTTTGATGTFKYLSTSETAQMLGSRYKGDESPQTDLIYENTTSEELYLTVNIIGSYLMRSNFRPDTPIQPGNSGEVTYTGKIIAKDELGVEISSTTIFTRNHFTVNISSDNEQESTGSINTSFSEWIPIDGTIELVIEYEILVTDQTVAAASITPLSKMDVLELYTGAADSEVKGVMIYEAFTRLIQLMTSETDTSKLLQSEILGRTDSEFQTYVSNGLLSLQHIMNGYAARGFTDKALNLKFRGLFQDASLIRPIGCYYDSVNDYFEIESIDNYYLDEIFPIHLGDVTELKMTMAGDYYFNEIKSGYPKSENEDTQGLNEFNVETEHSTPINYKGAKNLRSRLRASTIDIETLRRRNNIDYNSEDNKKDNYNFMCTVDSSYNVIQGNATNLNGFIGIEQYYNLDKTPRINQSRQGKTIVDPQLFKNTSPKIKFISAEKGQNISYTDPLTGLVVNEFDDIIPSEDSLILPEFYEFEGIYTEEIRSALKLHRHSALPFYDGHGNTIYAYIPIKGGIEANIHKQTAKYKLVRANETRLPI